jgi:hypothetical protein
MSRTRTLLTIAVLPLLIATFAACGGGGEEKTTETPGSPSTATPAQSAGITPANPQFSGNATASVNVGDQTFTFENGRCDLGPDDGWLAVNIGQAGSGDYFSLLVGADAAEPAGRKLARDGGEFTGQDCGVVSATVGGESYARAIDEACRVTLDADLKGGEFVGNTLEGEPMSGSFKC